MSESPSELTPVLVDDVTTLETANVVVWVITNKTKDYGDKFVVRRQVPIGEQLFIESACVVFDTLDQARAHLPPGLFCFPRDTNDDAVIVESWL